MNRADRRAWRIEWASKTPFSNDTVQRLTGTAWIIAHEISWLERCSRRDRPGRAPLVQCSQSYLARKAGVTREAVNRCVNKILEPLGLIEKTWRRPVKGEFQTCLYKLTKDCKFLLGRIINKLSSSGRNKSVMYTSPKPTAHNTSSSPDSQRSPEFARRE